MVGEDRKNGPEIQAIDSIRLPNIQRLDSEGTIPIYFIEGGTEQIARIEFVFPAGRKFENKRAVAALTSSLIQEGTEKKSSTEIAELLDFYGFRFKSRNDFDHAFVSISCLSKHFDKALELIFEIINTANFPEKELNVTKRTASNNLKIQLERNEFVAYRTVTESIFGKEHVYGYNTQPQDFLEVTREDILEFFKKQFKLSNAHILLAGNVSTIQLDSLIKTLKGSLDARLIENEKHPKFNQKVAESLEGKHLKLSIENSLQSSIKVAKTTFGRGHQDFEGLYILTTILGGYFGSRLMQSIREKHGYSYNVYASIELLENLGYLNISTEVGSQYTELALSAIFKEIDLLRETLIPESELKMVKNYLLGKILRELDGPFNSASTLRNLLVTGGTLENITQLVAKIRGISAVELQDLAKQYFVKKSFTTVVVS